MMVRALALWYGLFLPTPMLQNFAKIAIVAVQILSLPLLDMTASTWIFLLLREAVSQSSLRAKLLTWPLGVYGSA